MGTAEARAGRQPGGAGGQRLRAGRWRTKQRFHRAAVSPASSVHRGDVAPSTEAGPRWAPREEASGELMSERRGPRADVTSWLAVSDPGHLLGRDKKRWARLFTKNPRPGHGADPTADSGEARRAVFRKDLDQGVSPGRAFNLRGLRSSSSQQTPHAGRRKAAGVCGQLGKLRPEVAASAPLNLEGRSPPWCFRRLVSPTVRGAPWVRTRHPSRSLVTTRPSSPCGHTFSPCMSLSYEDARGVGLPHSRTTPRSPCLQLRPCLEALRARTGRVQPVQRPRRSARGPL